MIVDLAGTKPAPSTLEAMTNMPKPTEADESFSFQGLTEHFSHFVLRYSVMAALLMDFSRNKAFVSKRAWKMPVEWDQHQCAAIRSLKGSCRTPRL